MQAVRKSGVLTGALVGLLFTVALTAIFFMGNRLITLPFVPNDFFEWLTRVLPGTIVPTVIEIMVKIIRGLNLGPTDSTAKTAEYLIALVQFLVLGTVLGGLFFVVLRRRHVVNSQSYLPGAIFGGVIGVAMLLMSDSTNSTSSLDPFIRAIWILVVFVGWGAVLNWIYNDLYTLPDTARPAEVPAASAQQLDRRQFLIRVGGATAAITLVGGGVGLALGSGDGQRPVSSGLAPAAESTLDPGLTDGQGNPLPNAHDPVKPAPGTRPEYTPLKDHYRIDINLNPPVVAENTWSLPITGLVANPITLSLSDLRTQYAAMTQYVTLACISNPLGGDLTSTTKWTGVSLQQIMKQVQPTQDAGFLRITAADGFDEYVALDLINKDERIMLTYEWDGQPLLPEHGFPLRIYVPDLYGMKQPKWIETIEVVQDWQEGYWVRRGWSETAQMNATSVIDTVATNSIIKNGDQMLVPIGGIAHAGARGISKVEVQVDNGDWVEAQRRGPLSQTTWVIWRYDWPFSEGQHTFAVRCVDGKGAAQIVDVHDVAPDGATGIFSVNEYISNPTNT